MLTRKPPHGLFVTGTDTDVGKTYVGAMLAAEFRRGGKQVGVYKPVASGCSNVDGELVPEDAVRLWQAAGRPLALPQVCPQMFAAPLAPNRAAAVEGKRVDSALLRLGLEAWHGHEFVLVEGVGGLLSPICGDDLTADLAVDFAYPLLIVARNALGVINHVLQTILAAEHYKLQVKAVVLSNTAPGSSDASRDTNLDEIASRTDVPVFGPLEYGHSNPQWLSELTQLITANCDVAS